MVKDVVPTAPNQLWVSDITYIETQQDWLYLFLITDAYSKMILGYYLSYNMESINAIKALQMALATIRSNHQELIHHSDRGSQYCCHKYVSLLKANHIAISMTEQGDPLQNAMAERVNGILKDEWLYEMQPLSARNAYSSIPKIIKCYNQQRPHLSIDLLTPTQAHQKSGKLKKHWKNYYKRRTENYITLFTRTKSN